MFYLFFNSVLGLLWTSHLNQGSVSLVVEDFHPFYRPELFKHVEAAVGVGEVRWDVTNKQYLLVLNIRRVFIVIA